MCTVDFCPWRKGCVPSGGAGVTGPNAALIPGTVRPKPERPGSLLAHTSFRVHLYLWVALNAFLVLIWAATGGDGGFWPIWPMLGTGLPLGVHAAVRLATSSPGEHRDR